MADDLNQLALADVIRSARPVAAVLTTYNVWFPFLEQVVVPQLRAAGARAVLVLADAGQLADHLSERDGAPQHAGRTYALLPVRYSGAFHPKLMLLAGARDGQLVVGSHNLTLAGWAHSGEVTNRFGADERAAMQSAWQAIRGWAARAAAPPDVVAASLATIEGLAPWLRQPDAGESAFVAGGFGAPLWAAVRPRLPARATRCLVIGPSWDTRLAFLATVAREFAPQELVAAVDPALGAFPGTALPDGARLVSARALGALHGDLHAKMLWIEGADGGEWLVSGSANPSRPAWLSTGDTQGAENAEAVVVRQAPAGRSFLAELGLDVLFGAPAPTAAERELLEARQPTDGHRASGLLGIGVVDGDDVRVAHPSLAGGVTRIEPADLQFDAVGEGLLIREAAGETLLRVTLADGRTLAVIVHDGEGLAAGARTDSQRKLASALGALDTDLGGLPELLDLVERAILDQSVTVRPRRGRTGAGDADTPAQESAEAPETRIVEGGATRRRQRSGLASGDLVLLLDALLARLGEGLGGPKGGAPTVDDDARTAAMSEEELVDSDEEQAPIEVAFDRRAVAAECAKRLRRLARRLEDRLNVTRQGSAEDAARAIGLLAGALGMVQAIRERDLRLVRKPSDPELVPVELLDILLRSTALAWYGPSPIFARAREWWGESVRESSFAAALAAWLCEEVGWSVRPPAAQPLGGPPLEEREAKALTCTACVAIHADVAADPTAVARAEDALRRSTWSDDDLGAWREDLAHASALMGITAQTSRLARPPRPGDWVFATRLPNPKPLLVVDVVPGGAGKVRAISVGLRGKDALRYELQAVGVIDTAALQPGTEGAASN